ncbi:hypothetical protein [Kordiimonas aestuarii]|uniref:hypothetical protein n=1 Tax=Kordiimonas aestuarii TaxID=1005925 RepID=UPI0021D09D8B|nr:hypothetical protein [Kordiimonas aestuarii]
MRELAGIAGRHRRQKKAWAQHLQHTKECISAHLHEADANEPVLVLGAGLCLDLPLDALNAHPAGTLLVDAVLPRRSKRLLASYGNIETECADLTGFLDAFTAAEDPFGLTPPEIAPMPLAGYGMAVSCNILSQLPLAFAASPPLNDAEQELTTRVQKAHVRALMAMSCPALLITDYQRIETHSDHNHVFTSVDRNLLPGDPLETWQWHIAPMGETGRGRDITLNVGAWLLGK